MRREELSNFWDFVKRTPETNTPIRTICRELYHGMVARLSLCYNESYDMRGYDMWDYSFCYPEYEIQSRGRIILDFHKKTLVEQLIYVGYARSFRGIANVFFDYAVIYSYIPTLRSIALKSMKSLNLNSNSQDCRER